MNAILTVLASAEKMPSLLISKEKERKDVKKLLKRDSVEAKKVLSYWHKKHGTVRT